MIKDIPPINFNELNGKLVFVAADIIYDDEIWISDGTTNGTKLIKDINDNGDSGIDQLADIDGNLFFSAIDEHGCVDTSACYIFNTLVIIDNEFQVPFKLYPNPAKNDVHIDLGHLFHDVSVKVINRQGSIISIKQFGTTDKLCIKISGKNEIFFIEVTTKETKRKIFKVFLQ
jgi:ELWxxDGT repeat protein